MSEKAPLQRRLRIAGSFLLSLPFALYFVWYYVILNDEGV